VIEVGF